MEYLEQRECVFLCSADGVATGQARASDKPRMFFCVGLSSSQIQQSSLLEGISGTTGMTQLPKHVSQDDFLLWLTTCSDPVRPPQANDKLARIIKVADALSDRRLQQWANVLGERVSKVDWSSSDSCNGMYQALQSLPSNARTAVLQAALAVMGPQAALTSLPPSLHASLVGTMISKDGALTSPGDGGKAAQVFMTCLPPLGLPFSVHPPVRSLHIVGDDAQSASAELLADALRNFTSISKLQFSTTHSSSASHLFSGLSNSSAAVVLPAIWHATSLVDLNISMNGDDLMAASGEALDHLRGVLPHLTQLQRLRVGSIRRCCSEHGDDEGTAPIEEHQSCNRFLATVAAHPSLTFLHLRHSPSMTPMAFSGSFPLLQELVLHLNQSNMDHWFENDSTAQRQWRLLHLAGRQNSRPFAAFPALTKLEFSLSTDPFVRESLERWLPFRCVPGECPQLRSLSYGILPEDSALTAPVAEMWTSIASYVESCTHLQHLQLCYIHAPSESTRVQCLPNVSRLSELTSLALDGAVRDHRNAEYIQFMDCLSTLHSLKKLTLSLALGFNVLQMMQKLAGIQSFTELRLGNASDVLDWISFDAADVAHGLRSLKHLLSLRLANVSSSDAATLINLLPDLYMSRHLQQLVFRDIGVQGEGIDTRLCAVHQVVPQLPRLTRLELNHSLEVGDIFQLMTALAQREAARQPGLLVTHTISAQGSPCRPHADLARLAAEAATLQRGVQLAFQHEIVDCW